MLWRQINTEPPFVEANVHDGVKVYQDDIIIHIFDKVAHDQRLIALLYRLIGKIN